MSIVYPNPISLMISYGFFKDIRNLIAEWADVIGSCDRIWIRASGANRRIFMDYEEAIITKSSLHGSVDALILIPCKDDERLRTFPFPTRRPVGTFPNQMLAVVYYSENSVC